MKIYRFTILKLDHIPNDLSAFNFPSNGVSLEVTPFENQASDNPVGNYILLTAKRDISSLPISTEGYWEVPETERRICEEAVELIIAKFSIFHCVKYELFSPHGLCFTFLPETPEERHSLESCKGFPPSSGKLQILFSPPSRNHNWIVDLEDRNDGVFLLSEALNQSFASVSFRDLIRLFENAFSLPAKSLIKKLHQFLMPEMGYSRDEIQSWIDFRDPMSHADGKKSCDIFLQSHVGPIINRVQQAAYDVLYNKKEWNSRSKERREVWKPQVYSNGPISSVITDGSKNIQMNWTDMFDVYPRHAAIRLNTIDKRCIPQQIVVSEKIENSPHYQLIDKGSKNE